MVPFEQRKAKGSTSIVLPNIFPPLMVCNARFYRGIVESMVSGNHYDVPYRPIVAVNNAIKQCN